MNSLDDWPEPPTPCVKCGSVLGHDGPKYRLAVYYVDEFTLRNKELLDFTCRMCGYVRSEPTHDTPANPPPPEDIGGIHYPKRGWWRFGL